VAEVFGIQVEEPLPEGAQLLQLGHIAGGEPVPARALRDKGGHVGEGVPVGERDQSVKGRFHEP
jgi:hypothetical protein